MSNNIMFVPGKEFYFYSYEEKCVYPFKINLFSRIIRIICRITHISIPLICLSKNILSVNKIIITDNTFSISLIKTLMNYKSQEDLILYYLNNINENNKYMMKYFKIIYTFDSEDAKKFNIKYKHTPFSDKIKLNNSIVIYDTLFLGRAKERITEIENLKHTFDKFGIKNKFLVLDTENKELKLNSFINYREYIDLISQTRCLIEINQKNQVGCSLRFMESLFFQKKLITNNRNIINDYYYDYNNVYILGYDDRNIIDFIHLPYNDNNTNLSPLFFENWIEEF
jgi:hypothetical protein